MRRTGHRLMLREFSTDRSIKTLINYELTASSKNDRLVCIIPGTAQTISSWIGHKKPISRRYNLLQYETRGQGSTRLPLTDCSLARHVDDFLKLLDSLPSPMNSKVDLCGFSFGGRVALAIAAAAPSRVRKMVLTGVPAERTSQGLDILNGWKDMLRRDDLKSFVWQAMLDGHSESFLKRHENKLSKWVESSVSQNRADAILAIVDQTHHEDMSSPYHSVRFTRSCSHGKLLTSKTRYTHKHTQIRLAERIPHNSNDVLFIGGSEDKISEPDQIARLANVGNWQFDLIQGAGHAVPIEKPIDWRNRVLSFFDS